MNHNELTGKFAVHPFAFVGATDPAADATNGVTANKAWIDTSVAPTLKVRNATNTAWQAVIGGGSGGDYGWTLVGPWIYAGLPTFPGSAPAAWTGITYV